MTDVVAVAIAAGLFLALSPTMWLVFLLPFIATIWNPSLRIGPFGVYASTAIVAVVFLKAMAAAFSERSPLIPLQARTDVAMAVFASYTLFCTFIFGQGIAAYKRQTGLLLFYMGYVAIRICTSTNTRLTSILKWAGLSSTSAGILGLYTYYFRPFLGTKKMAYGTFGNPNGLASYLILTIPLLLYFIIKDRRNILWWSLPTVSILCLIRTGSRTGLIAMSIIAFIWIVHRWPKLLLLALAFSPAFIFFAETRWQLYDRYKTIFDMTSIIDSQRTHLISVDVGQEAHSFQMLHWTSPGQYASFPDSLGARYVIWGQALAKIPEAPIFGWGPNTVRLSGLPYDSKLFDNCFNQYISITLDFGLLGLLCICSIAWAVVKDDREGKAKGLANADLSPLLLSILAGQIIHACAEDPIYAVLSNWMLAMIIALSVSNSLLSRPPEDAI